MGHDQIQIAFDDGKGIVEFVGHAGNHLAQAGKFFGLAQLLFQPGAVGDFAEEELEGVLSLVINAGAFDLGDGGAAVFLQDPQGAPGAEMVDPFRGAGRRRGRALRGLAEGGQGLFPRFVPVQAEQSHGGFVQVKNAQVAGGGDNDGFARLVEQIAVLFLG